MARILLVEDEANLALTLSDLFAADGHAVTVARDGETAVREGTASAFDLAVIDVMLPRKSGFEVCRELRSADEMLAILMLTARTEISDRVLGLRLGADDYLPKPFDPAELLARVEALLRRAGKIGARQLKLEFDEIEVDFERALLRKSGERVNLTGKELQLLRYLADNTGRIVPREEILKNVWEYRGDVSSRTVDVHVAWLRQKLERNPQQPEHIHTVRGKGYRFSF